MAWRTYAADEPRFLTPRNWLLFEGQRTNDIRNPRGEGGATPTFWQLFTFPSGITASFVGSGTEDGMAYVDMRIVGTPGSTSNSAGWSPEATNGIAAAAGQTRTSSVFCRLAGGSLANLGVSWGFQDRDAANAGLAQWLTTITPTSAPLATQRHSRTATTGANTAFAWPVMRFSFTAGLAVDCTLRHSWPQMELGAFASTPILPPLGSPGAATRSRDSLVIPTTGLLPAFEGSIIFEALVSAAAPAGADQMIFQLDGGFDTDRVRVRNLAGGTSLVAGTVIAGASTDATSAGAIVPGVPFKGILTMSRAGRLAVLLSGGTVQSINGLPASLPWLRAANNVAGSAPLNGELGRIETRSLIVPDGEMQSVLNAV